MINVGQYRWATDLSSQAYSSKDRFAELQPFLHYSNIRKVVYHEKKPEGQGLQVF